MILSKFKSLSINDSLNKHWEVSKSNDGIDVTTYSKHLQKPDNVRRFEAITASMADIYARKNKDYGNSFDESLDEDGLLVSKIRLGDKYKRFSQLIKNPAEVEDESIRDTLIDMAAYAIMTVMWMDEYHIPMADEEDISDPELAKHYKDQLDALRGGVVFKPEIPHLGGADFDGDTVQTPVCSHPTDKIGTFMGLTGLRSRCTLCGQLDVVSSE